MRTFKGVPKHQDVLSPQKNKNENFFHYLAFLSSSWIVIKKQKKALSTHTLLSLESKRENESIHLYIIINKS